MRAGLRTILAKLIHVFRRGRWEQDFENEIQAHLARLEDRFKERGMSAERARSEARRVFGGIERLKAALVLVDDPYDQATRVDPLISLRHE